MSRGPILRYRLVSNAKQLEELWGLRERVLKTEARKATKYATLVLYRESLSLMEQLVYAHPIPSNYEEKLRRSKTKNLRGKYTFKGGIKAGQLRPKGRRPAWKRTGTLKKHHTWKMVNTYEGVIINDASTKKAGKGHKDSTYALAREEMRNTRWKAPFMRRAIRNTLETRRAIFREVYRNAIRAGRVYKVRLV